jgi:hypothetical protein
MKLCFHDSVLIMWLEGKQDGNPCGPARGHSCRCHSDECARRPPLLSFCKQPLGWPLHVTILPSPITSAPQRLPSLVSASIDQLTQQEYCRTTFWHVCSLSQNMLYFIIWRLLVLISSANLFTEPLSLASGRQGLHFLLSVLTRLFHGLSQSALI